ncbi:MAG: RNA polymerase-associated protein RapA [Legionella sp.]|jgi:ATP-dependent helicase HepA
MIFIVGQRWISNTESQLGLGIITDVTRRQVSLLFPAANEERIYAIDSAPLSRITYKEGEEVVTTDMKKVKVTYAEDQHGLFIYIGTDDLGNQIRVEERALNSFIKLSTPQQRLFSGLIDKLESFQLRIDTLAHANRLQQSPVQGLLGSRTNHLPHQLYIASEVAQRYAPRVLLADEVGLGKTIEAGMIIHYQLQTGRAKRVLIVVPESLIHQWLVEMIRRFNLHFSIIDQNNYDSFTEEDFEDLEEPAEDIQNKFEYEQLVLCSLDFLLENNEAQKQVLATEWDILVIDEAHHLQWSPKKKSPQYNLVEKLSKKSAGLLLLTATPEQVGIQSHFARLRLLDPARFYDLEQFEKEELGYKAVNDLVQELLEHSQTTKITDLDAKLQKQLKKYLGSKLPTTIKESIKSLLDRHGTGRVLFRNTRSVVHGFPQCRLHQYALPAYPYEPEDINTLFPEDVLDLKSWLQTDPRVAWLAKIITELKPEKILVICAKAKTAIALEQHLKMKVGIRCTAFHEGLSIIERDRAAAYFAEQENGAQVMICSEIGSEGRNFQFAHNLVLFDLPLNPDLLEQRIGRLDRIGQQHIVEIHAPYSEGSVQETLFRWFHEGMSLFEKSSSIGCATFSTFEHKLVPLLLKPNPTAIDNLIEATRAHTEEIHILLQEGRDRLLELSSCDSEAAHDLIELIEKEENNQNLIDYMGQVFQEFGIDHEFHSDHTEILRPTDHMKTSHFPGLKEDGVTCTYSRRKALIREDIEFLSWEHPMVNECMEMILDSELGNTALTTISVKSVTPGTVFLESFFTINCIAPKYLQLDRFLSMEPIRILMDVSLKNLSHILDYKQLNLMCQPVKLHLASAIIKQIRESVEAILEKSTEIAEEKSAEFIKQATSTMNESLEGELNRLVALKKINPSIREDEIDFIKQQIEDSEYYLRHAVLKLQGLRVVINK